LSSCRQCSVPSKRPWRHGIWESDSPEERFEVFGTFVPEDYDQEVRERWKETSEFEDSQRRVSQYTKEDWTRMKAAAEENGRALVEAMTDGVAPESDRAMALAERHREHISRWFYECGYEIHRGLGEMYVADPRFTAFYDRMSPDWRCIFATPLLRTPPATRDERSDRSGVRNVRFVRIVPNVRIVPKDQTFRTSRTSRTIRTVRTIRTPRTIRTLRTIRTNMFIHAAAPSPDRSESRGAAAPGSRQPLSL
jgi:hypothetical protein